MRISPRSTNYPQTTFFKSSFHRAAGRPTLRLFNRGFHSRTFRPHRLIAIFPFLMFFFCWLLEKSVRISSFWGQRSQEYVVFAIKTPASGTLRGTWPCYFKSSPNQHHALSGFALEETIAPFQSQCDKPIAQLCSHAAIPTAAINPPPKIPILWRPWSRELYVLHWRLMCCNLKTAQRFSFKANR